MSKGPTCFSAAPLLSVNPLEHVTGSLQQESNHTYLASAMEREWSEKLFVIPDDVPATMFLSGPKHTVPVLLDALAEYT